MRVKAVWAALGVLALIVAGCSNPFSRKYEYEEQLYLSVNGSATVLVDASLHALVVLRGLSLDPAGRAGVEREQVRDLFVSAGCEDVRVGQPWVRDGRKFVQVRVTVTALSDLHRCGPLAWSSYRFERDGDRIHFQQTVGAAAGGTHGAADWNGTELVAFKLHAPSRIFFHNVKRLEDGSNGEPGRGNILTWEQRLTDRRAGQPLQLDVRMGAESILFRTLWLFVGAFVAAVAALMAIIWWTIRRARQRQKT